MRTKHTNIEIERLCIDYIPTKCLSFDVGVVLMNDFKLNSSASRQWTTAGPKLKMSVNKSVWWLTPLRGPLVPPGPSFRSLHVRFDQLGQAAPARL
jgi:hypothetical protein